MKRKSLSLLVCLLATFALAAANYGTDHYALGEFQLAKKWFEQQVAQSPGESNYYLGEIAFKEGNLDAASALFEKGLAADPTYVLNLVGKGKLLVKTNLKAAEVLFATALKKNKKDIAVHLAIVSAYSDNGMTEQATVRLAAAKKAGKNSPWIYIYEGDQILASTSETRVGDAALKYSQAMYFDPTNMVAQMRYGQAFLLTDSYDIPIETFKKVVAAHPDYSIAIRDLAAAYTNKGVYELALTNYAKYFELGRYGIEDIRRYAQNYFFTDQYEKSLELINRGLAINPDHFVLNRLRMYCAAKSKDSLALDYAKKFFSLRAGSDVDSKFIYKDYLAQATIFANNGQFQEALLLFDKVLNNQDEKVDKILVYQEQAACYTKMKEYVKAGDTYQTIIEIMGMESADPNYFFQQGTSYYYAAQAMRKDSTDAGKALLLDYVTKADSAFARTSRRSPGSYVSYMWRGNLNVLLDPESTKGLSKPYYETAIEIILKKVEAGEAATKYKSQLQSAYRYFAVYYYMQQDKTNATLYSNKVLELNPTEANAKAILENYKAQEAAGTTATDTFTVK